ncbi:putative acyl-CoA-binding domain-containing protein 5 isoform X1 [Apostichopus japonicus]|uniref:Putative acyl-CoA-binding domain-containing protein 5 isoform X1 n=1 Tax=Stichopus japonicus TaxID=307972 RepID=A0A2G8KY27_STIJA|nr:putative acyl-CoA-binding domain-containing protein 5 isoform X1 [Apostichopus japonicus]
MASAEEKFAAAVQAIKKLPKDGPFQPSYDMMKKFYGLFKQATEGPCNEPRPAFWNAIKKAKWEAWSSLGDMSKLEAQEGYVNEMLKIMVVNFKANDVNHMVQIIEAMPQTDEVRNFLRVMGPFFEMVTVTEDGKVQNGGIPNRNVAHLPNGEHNGAVDGGLPQIVSKVNGTDTEIDKDVSQLSNGHIKKHDLEVLDSVKENNTTGLSDSSHPIYVNEDQTHDSVEGDVSSSSGTEDEFCDSIDQPDISMERKVRFADCESLPVVGEDRPLTSTPMVGDRITTEAEVHNIPGSQPTQPRSNHSGSTSGLMNGHTSSRMQKSSSIRTTPRVDMEVSNMPFSSFCHSKKKYDSVDTRNRLCGWYRGWSPTYEEDTFILPEEMSEHNALVLERLQRDMNSVLVRLNTLETLAVTRHQMEAEGPDSPERRVKGQKDTWWPFSRLDMKTVFFILVWPFVVNWAIKFISRRRRFPRK